MAIPSSICIFGAGSIGCYVGGRLAATGGRVTFIGRPRLAQQLQDAGLHLSDWQGAHLEVPAEAVDFATDPTRAGEAGLVLVTVKSAATAEAGAVLAQVVRSDALVISFQNGLHNAELLQQHLPGRTVLPGIVEFNVVNRGAGIFHQGSEGALLVQDHPGLAPYLDAFAAAGLPLQRPADMRPVQWGKLLLNLNNAINALCGVPLKQELSQRAFRQCLALAQAEALELLGAAGIRPAQLTPLPPQLLPKLLGVPDFIFSRVASKMLAIDPLARSSMWEDLQAGRLTEVDWLNGEVLRLARQLGRAAPVNARLVALVHDAEKGGRRDWTGPELLHSLRTARA